MIETINLQPDEPVFVARSLDALIDKWLEDCAQRLAQDDTLYSKTVIGYTSKIAYFRRWWSTTGPAQNWELRERDFQEFGRWLTHKSGLAYNSRKDVLRRLIQLFRWAFKRSYVKRDYSIWVPEADGSAPLRTAAPLSALHKLMQAAKESDYPVRNSAILAIAIGTGARRTEICLLNIEDVSFLADGSGTIQIHHAKEVRGREVHGRIVVFDNHAGRYILRWVDALGKEQGPLFPGLWRNKPMQPTSMGHIVDKLIVAAGIKDQIQNLHDLRRMFVTINRRERKGGSYDKSLQRQVGHSSALMTNHYDLSDVEALRDDILSPFALMVEQR